MTSVTATMSEHAIRLKDRTEAAQGDVGETVEHIGSVRDTFGSRLRSMESGLEEVLGAVVTIASHVERVADVTPGTGGVDGEHG